MVFNLQYVYYLLHVWNRGRDRFGPCSLVLRVDLTRLPPSLLPPKLKLGGRLSAELAFKGKAEDARAQRPAGWNQPAIEARATWSGGRIGALREVELTTDARLAAGRASGHVDLSTLGAKVNASFNLPTAWPPPTTAASSRATCSTPPPRFKL